MTFTKKNAFVTGSSSGIGQRIALKLAEMGSRVAVHYHQNKSAANDTLAQLRLLGSDGFIVQGDVTQPDDVCHLFRTVEAEFGTLDIYVNNSPLEIPTFFYPILEMTQDQWDTAVNSQAKAFLIAGQKAARLMPDGGRILALTYTTGGLQPWVGMGAANAVLETLVCYFAAALAPCGITVNAISSSWAEDNVLKSLPEPVQELQRNRNGGRETATGRLGVPADIGKVVALLCSADAGCITGQIIYADGNASLVNSEVAPEINCVRDFP